MLSSIFHVIVGAPPQPPVHVYIDFSNINIGCHKVVNKHVKPKNLISLIEGGHSGSVSRRVVVESLPLPLIAGRQEEWRALQYDANVSSRGPGQREQNVDEALHAAMLMDLANTPINKIVNVILCTGDGNTNGSKPTNFPNIIHRMLERGWMVELRCFRASCSGVWRALAVSHAKQFKIEYLDEVSHVNDFF